MNIAKIRSIWSIKVTYWSRWTAISAAKMCISVMSPQYRLVKSCASIMFSSINNCYSNLSLSYNSLKIFLIIELDHRKRVINSANFIGHVDTSNSSILPVLK